MFGYLFSIPFCGTISFWKSDQFCYPWSNKLVCKCVVYFVCTYIQSVCCACVDCFMCMPGLTYVCMHVNMSKFLFYAFFSTKEYANDVPAGVVCVPFGMGKFVCVCIMTKHDCLQTLARMNHEVLYLVAIFTVGSLATGLRAIMFNLAGEKFVARLRKKVLIQT